MKNEVLKISHLEISNSKQIKKNFKSLKFSRSNGHSQVLSCFCFCLMKIYSRQPFGNPNLPKKTETSSAPKKSTVREQCKNMFLDALKETPNYPEGKFLN